MHGGLVDAEVGQHVIGQRASVLQPERDQLVVKLPGTLRFPGSEIDIAATAEVDNGQILGAIVAILGERQGELWHDGRLRKTVPICHRYRTRNRSGVT